MNINLTANIILVLVAMICAGLLIRKTSGISPEYKASWLNVSYGMLCANAGLMLNLSRDFPDLSSSYLLGPTQLNLIF